MKKFLTMSLSVVYGDKDKHKSGTECYVIMDKIYDLKTVSNSRLCKRPPSDMQKLIFRLLKAYL